MEEVRRLFDILTYQQKHYPQNVALAAKEQNRWRTYALEEFRERVDQVSACLICLGVEPGDKVAVISHNRPEWNFVDMAVQQIGAATVPLYPSINPENYAYILNHAESKIVFVENRDMHDKLETIRDDLETVEEVYAFEEIGGALHWTRLLSEDVACVEADIEARKLAVKEDDLATIIYTSGTTGKPKGVMLSHKNILSNTKACIDLVPLDDRHKALSLLPLSHVFERMVNYLYMLLGVSIYYAESPDTFAENMREVQPQVFTTVPRLLEKIYERIVSRGMEQPAPLQWIFFWALDLAENYELEGQDIFYRAQHMVADRLVFQKWREAFGNNLIAVISGGAALNPKLARVFTAAGIPILEGYGMTETSPVLTANRYEKSNRRIGSIGKPLENVEVAIAEDGEILAKGPNVMQGYYKKPNVTQEVCENGWIHTGDMGEMDEDGFLYFTDRVTNIFKTSGGKFVVPQRIESEFESSYLIEHAVAIGDDRKMVTAIISPDFENLKSWCEKRGIPWQNDREAMLRREEIQDEYEKIVQRQNRNLDHVERIKQYTLVPDVWTVEGSELTPTLKVKREHLKQKYAEEIERMYEQS